LIELIAIAPTLVEAGNLSEYERFRLETIERYGKTTDPIEVSILLKACLLAPADEALLARLRPYAAELATIVSTPNHPKAMDAYQSAFTALTLSMMAYQSGNFTGALTWSRLCLAVPDANQAREAAARAVVAAAAARLGKLDEARSHLAKADAIFAGPFDRDVYYPRGKGQGHWLDWAIARVLLREAHDQERAIASRGH
jgi:hypothetical protein